MKINYSTYIIHFLLLMSCDNSLQMINTEDVYQTEKFGFSQAIRSDDLLFLSGQVGWDTTYELTGDKLFEDQLKQSFINVEELVCAGGSTTNGIIFLRFYVKQLDDTKRGLIGRYIKQYYPEKYKPATTLIGVESLARKELLIEIEGIAKI
jgi:enamine deaminase RidA (YjgF/YER057c/UK114 family)